LLVSLRSRPSRSFSVTPPKIPGRKGVLRLASEKDRAGLPTTTDGVVASIKGEDKRAVEAFLSAVETISKLNKDPEFYNLAINAVRE
jgi:hypothetical protein